ncbi:MAG: zf-HC2 domain-containing protein [Fibrobacteria bacterium]|nr:zf-HC2 domain-containing protein [Fibrobacteria bacterium]
MSDCTDLLGALGDYLDGDEQTTMCQELKKHMAGCAKCRLVVDTARRTVELYRGEELVEFPTDFRQRLHGNLKDAWMRRPRATASAPR